MAFQIKIISSIQCTSFSGDLEMRGYMYLAYYTINQNSLSHTDTVGIFYFLKGS